MAFVDDAGSDAASVHPDLGQPGRGVSGRRGDLVDPGCRSELGLVYFGTGNLYPWTGRQPGKNLFGVSDMAVDWKTGALRWYFQEMHHDIWDLDTPNPPNRINVPIDGKMTPVIAHGGKNGYLYVMNAENGGPVPHFKIVEEKVLVSNTTNARVKKIDGLTLNGLWPSQPVVTGAAACIFPVDWSVVEADRLWVPGRLSADRLRRYRAEAGCSGLVRPERPGCKRQGRLPDLQADQRRKR